MIPWNLKQKQKRTRILGVHEVKSVDESNNKCLTHFLVGVTPSSCDCAGVLMLKTSL